MNAAPAAGSLPSVNFQLERDPFGHLVYTDADGTQHIDIVPVRAFPIAAPDEGLSLVSQDGHELVWIGSSADLPPDIRALLDEELAVREFTPVITRLNSVSTYSTPSSWEVETDHGPTRFVLKGEEDIRRLNRTTLLIASGHGIQFLVRDMSALDRHSKRLLERFL
jgi:hypothetical protein